MREMNPNDPRTLEINKALGLGSDDDSRRFGKETVRIDGDIVPISSDPLINKMYGSGKIDPRRY